MNAAQRTELISLLGENVKFEFPMADYTTLKVGGNAEAFCRINDETTLIKVVSFFKTEEIIYEVLGWGSNIVIKDNGVQGAIIVLSGSLAAIGKCEGNATAIVAGGGCRLVDLLNFCRKNELGGIEFLAGIPGTVGGAVAMNAGAFGGEIGEKLVRIDLMTPEINIESIDRSRLVFSYRSCNLEKGSVIVRCYLKLERVSKKEFSRQVAIYKQERKKSQPLKWPSAGSVFKNPPGKSAGRLIESAGLKGKRIGGAVISEMHANFILNKVLFETLI